MNNMDDPAPNSEHGAAVEPLSQAAESGSSSSGRGSDERPSAVWGAIKRLLRTRVTAGLIVVLPVYLTIIIVRFVFQIMRDSSQWLVHAVLKGEWLRFMPESWNIPWTNWTEEELGSPKLQWAIGIFSVFLTVFLLYSIGLLAANVVGKRVLAVIEKLLDRLPLVKTVYRASKQILVTFTGDQATTFQRVALVPFPTPDVRSVGFVTGYSKDSTTGEELCTCFIASTPNPTTGFVFVMRRSDVVELDWAIEDAIKVIMSGGIIVPAAMTLSTGPALREKAPPSPTQPVTPEHS